MYFCVYTKLCVQNCVTQNFVSTHNSAKQTPCMILAGPDWAIGFIGLDRLGGWKEKRRARKRDWGRIHSFFVFVFRQKINFRQSQKMPKGKAKFQLLEKTKSHERIRGKTKEVGAEIEWGRGWLGMVRWIYLCLRYHSPSLSRPHSR